MEYEHKWQIFDALKPTFASCEVKYEADKIPETAKKKLAKMLRLGYATVARGDSGILYDAFCRQYEIPRTRLLKRKGRNWYFYTECSDANFTQAMKEFSKVDCMAHVLHLSNNPPKNEWGRTAENFRKYDMQEDGSAMKEGRNYYNSDFKGTYGYIYQLHEEKRIAEIISEHVLTAEYKLKVEEAIALINTKGASLVMSYNS
jgi:predicted transcriptional regulator